MQKTLSVIEAPDTLQTREHAGVTLTAHAGFEAFDREALVEKLRVSKELLLSPEEARAFAEEAATDTPVIVAGDHAHGVLRISGKAMGGGSDPMAMGLAHVGVDILRGVHPDLGDMLKVSLDIRAAHIHRMGVGMGLHTVIADAVCAAVIELVDQFQRTALYDTTIIWSFDVSFASCDELGLKDRLNKELIAHVYEPMLVIDEDEQR